MALNGTRKSPVVQTGESSPSAASEERRRVLVVDDESVIADSISKILTISGYSAMAAYDGDSAIEAALHTPPELLITDVALPGKNGIELAADIKRIYPDCRILLFSGHASTNDLVAAANRAGHRFTLLHKPLPPWKLLEMVAANFGAEGALQAVPAA